MEIGENGKKKWLYAIEESKQMNIRVMVVVKSHETFLVWLALIPIPQYEKNIIDIHGIWYFAQSWLFSRSSFLCVVSNKLSHDLINFFFRSFCNLLTTIEYSITFIYEYVMYH